VPSMRNPFSVESVLARGYQENSENNTVLPYRNIPKLLQKARPVHEFVKVDVFIPGCPPHADVIYQAINQILEGNHPNLSELTRFGA
jgi:NAD-reducing hydrogenase small subunit